MQRNYALRCRAASFSVWNQASPAQKLKANKSKHNWCNKIPPNWLGSCHRKKERGGGGGELGCVTWLQWFDTVGWSCPSLSEAPDLNGSLPGPLHQGRPWTGSPSCPALTTTCSCHINIFHIPSCERSTNTQHTEILLSESHRIFFL